LDYFDFPTKLASKDVSCRQTPFGLICKGFEEDFGMYPAWNGREALHVS
jgi:hypothetical protein